MSGENEIRALGERWARAERHGDVATLDALTVEDFTLVGPLGFLLDKQRWLDRYRSGALVTHVLDWRHESVRRYGDTAVVIGNQTQRTEYRGNPVDGQLRATHVAVRHDGQWRLAGMHLSPIGEPPAFAARPGGSDSSR